jgi:hypothetical protein
MTPKQSLTHKHSLIRRSLVVLSTVLLAAAWAVGISTPASAAAPRALEIVSVTTEANTCPSAARCAILEGQEFEVLVRVVDRNGEPATVSKDTTIVLEEVSGGGSLVFPDGNNEATILRGGSEATFTVLEYTQSANPVLRVRVTSGVELTPDQIAVPIALSAVADNAPQRGATIDLDDPGCGAGNGVPTSDEPTCGHLLTTGALGDIVMSVGSCEDAGPCRTNGGITALVVTVNADIQHSQGEHSTVILSCDKVLCGGTGVPKPPVIYTFDNNGDLTNSAGACPRKNDLGNLEICVDYVQSMRSDGDLYLQVLFDHDLRMSG